MAANKQEQVTLLGTSEVSNFPFDEEKQDHLMCANIIGAGVPQERASLRLVAVIDRSGSMTGTPLRLVKDALQFILKKLNNGDCLSIVLFGSTVKILLDMTEINDSTRKSIQQDVEGIRTAGCTHLSGGLLRGIKILKDEMAGAKPMVNSLMVFTDGLANDGITCTTKLSKVVSDRLSELTQSCTIHTFGFGCSHNPKMLRGVSDIANGMYYFIENVEQIPAAFAECFGGVASVAVSHAKLTVQTVNGIDIRNVFSDAAMEWSSSVANHCIISLGDIRYGEEKNIPIAVHLPKCDKAVEAMDIVHLTLEYTCATTSESKQVSSVITVGRPIASMVDAEAEMSSMESRQLDTQRNRVTVAEALQRATALGEKGDLKKAREILHDTLEKIRESKTRDCSYSKNLMLDIEQALECMKSIDHFRKFGSKFLFSLSRSHYQQRSSGISSKAASSYLTPQQVDLLNELQPGSVQVTDSDEQSVRHSKDNRTKDNKSKDNKKVKKDDDLKSTVSTSTSVEEEEASPERTKRAVRRLLSDLKEVHKYPLSTVAALPLEQDFFEWHCSLTGPKGSSFSDICFHIILQLTHTYPFQPPKLYLCSYLNHENVFGSWLCLDMLEENTWNQQSEANTPYTGWSSAYSMQSILVQLQSFLFDKAKTDPSSIERARREAAKYSCSVCGHDGAEPSKYFPTLPAFEGDEDDELDDELFDEAPQIVVTERSVITFPTHPLKYPGKSKVNRVKERAKQLQQAVEPQSAEAEKIIEKLSEKCDKEPCKKESRPMKPKKGDWSSFYVSLTGNSPVAVLEQRNPAPVSSIMSQQATEKERAQKQLKQQKEAHLRKQNRHPRQRLRGKEDIGIQQPRLVKKENVKKGDWKTLYLSLSEQLNQYQQEDLKVRATVPVQAVEPSREKKQSKRRRQKKSKKEKAVQAVEPLCISESVKSPLKVELVKAIKPREAVKQKNSTVTSESIVQEVEAETETETAVVIESFEEVFKRVSHDSSRGGLDGSGFVFLNDQLIIKILLSLDRRYLSSVSLVCKQFLRLAMAPELWRDLFEQYAPGFVKASLRTGTAAPLNWKAMLMREKERAADSLVCFHSKATYADHVLGIPIEVKRNKRTRKIQYISSPLDLLSHDAFLNDHVRKSVWKQPFTHWLPLYLSEEHGARAWPLIESAIARLASDRPDATFLPLMALDTIPRLMNTMVVNLMSGAIHTSTLALEGYCAFHHLLLMVLQRYPALVDSVDRRIARFIRSEPHRTKEHTPNLGEFLPLLTVSDRYTWRDVRAAYLHENFDRNVLWSIKSHPRLARMSGVSAAERTRGTFSATQTSMRLLMFHVMFLKLARPAGLSCSSVAHNYSLFFGRPISLMKQTMREECVAIQKVTSWPMFFSRIGLSPAPNTEELNSWLCVALRNSKKKGYHH